MNWVIVLAAFVTATILTGLVRRYALRHNILDIPNERSSHTTIVPRGGGIAVVSVFLAALAVFYAFDQVSLRLLASLGLSGFFIAVVGYFDDKQDLRVSVRLAAHIVAASVFLALIDSDMSLQIGGLVIGNKGMLLVLSGLYLIWMLNLFNFMDGIDGIAGVEAVTTAIGAGVLLYVAGHGDLAFVCFALAASCAGFLAWNWPPAKIFMGDAGSGFLGFTLAAISIVAHVEGALEVWVWLILTGVFVVDATITLFTRMIRGRQWMSAHRSHAYQKASRRLGSHFAVTSIVLVVNLLWLFPLALLAAKVPGYGWWLTLLAWTPLIAATLLMGAGRPD